MRKWVACSSAASAEHGLEARGQRASPERLGHEVIGAELEDAYLVVLVAPPPEFRG